jgi:hypothetical protein
VKRRKPRESKDPTKKEEVKKEKRHRKSKSKIMVEDALAEG